MDDISSHGNQLFLFLMTIPIQLFLVFVLSHLLPSFLDHASHNLSFLIFSWFNPSMKPPLTFSLSPAFAEAASRRQAPGERKFNGAIHSKFPPP
jgi:hypothetical protein